MKKKLLLLLLVIILLPVHCFTEICLPKALIVIHHEAFANAAMSDVVTIPNGVTLIDSRAFANTGIHQIILPPSLLYIADDILEGCTDVKAKVEKRSYAQKWCEDHQIAYSYYDFTNNVDIPIEQYDDLVICQNNISITSALIDYSALFTKRTGIDVEIISGGGSSDYNTVLRAEMQSDREPDIFVIDGNESYNLWKNRILDMTGADWTAYTDLAYKADGKIVGFPVSVEGYGLAYNKDILDAAGIDPSTLTNIDEYRYAFQKISSMMENGNLDLDMVVAMVTGTSTGMTWVTGLHNFNIYLTVGLPRNDKTMIDLLLNGQVDNDRFHSYCQYVDLLFQYSSIDMLINGTQGSQLATFANGKAAFYHQGNWMDSSLLALKPDFQIGYAPHAFLQDDTDGIVALVPSWYVINANGNVNGAIQFLNDLVLSADGQHYMGYESGMIPAFSNIESSYVGPLTSSLKRWVSMEKTYGYEANNMPNGFGMGTLGPVYELLAAGAIDADTFEIMMKDVIANLASK